MKKTIKENWFKLLILFFSASLLILGILFYRQYSKQGEKLLNNDSNKIETIKDQTSSDTTGEKLEESNKNIIDKKSDEYVVTYGDTGTPITWELADLSSVILDETISTYKDTLISIREVQEKEKATVSSAYSILARTDDPDLKNQVQTLIKYEESYLESGEKLIGLLGGLVSKYTGLKNATAKRDAPTYLYYMDEIKKLESQKNSILDDYQNKQNIKQNYAKSIL
jgi:hypothetical protein